MLLFVALLAVRRRRTATNGMISLALNARRYYAKVSQLQIEAAFEIKNLTSAQHKESRIVPRLQFPYNSTENLELLDYFCGLSGDQTARDACTLMEVLMVQPAPG